MAEREIDISKGNILLFFAYEVAYSVKLEKLGAGFNPQELEGGITLQRSKSHYVRFESLPILIRLGSERLTLGDREATVAVQARLFDFGVVSLCYRLPFSGSLSEMVSLSALLSKSDIFFEWSKAYLDRIREIARPALVNPIDSPLVEDYAIFQACELGEPISGKDLLDHHGRKIALILRAEEQPLSEQETQRTLANNISYYPDDILIVDWDRAFLYDREENTDHIDIIEFANTQLLDMRYFDGWLDRELERLYQNIQASWRQTPLFRVARYRRLSKRVMLLMTDVMFLTDQIENSLKAIDTLYAARVHKAIGQKLYLDEWRGSLHRKLAALRDISNNLNIQIYNLRSVILELTIVILILVEIVLSFIR